ncbi:6791_t:CDS:2 [Paraglomus brasilianum]|uniref:6791_t:CDS:1 n=1 Tax=Paraglomus brasilianum TaxID=144538 RepID=A0A9N8VK47_9GLOM|nr:6791_t:CDS:2 [Paraglomus brasilianum]
MAIIDAMAAVPNIVAKNPPNSYAAEDSQKSGGRLGCIKRVATEEYLEVTLGSYNEHLYDREMADGVPLSSCPRSQASPYGYADSRPSGVFVSDRARGYRNPFGNYFDDVE